MVERRNVGIIGAPSSESNEVLAAILRLGTTPPAPPSFFVLDGMAEWESPQPYNLAARKKLFGKDDT